MAWDTLNKDADHENNRYREKLIGVYIGVLAVILALCSLGGSNASSEAMLKNIEASNNWAFFQAKNARRLSYKLQADQLDVLLAANPSISDGVKTNITGKIADYQAQEKILTSDPEKKEGLEELWTKGKALEAERDMAMKRGPYFEYGQALLQIAIVLASVAIISGGNAVLAASVLVGIFGAISMMGGYTLAFTLPSFLA